MTKKDLFKIILKLYGLYSVLELIVQIPNISYMIYYDSYNEINWLFLLVPAVSLMVVYILLFKPVLLIQLFKLDHGFDNNDTNNSMNGQDISKIAMVIIAVFMIVSNLGSFLSQIVFSFKSSVSTNSLNNLLEVYNPNPVNYNAMLSSGLNLLFGFLLLTNYTRLSKWIDRINNKNVG
jgi:hypothetical protein